MLQNMTVSLRQCCYSYNQNGTRIDSDVPPILINCITDAVRVNKTSVYILDAVHVDVTFMGRVYAGW